MDDHAEHKSWFSRNWGWAVPVGGCLTLIVLFFVFLGSVFFGISKAFTGSAPYQDGLVKINQDEYVVEILGHPIESNGIMQGNISFENDAGNADIHIPVKGSKGEAELYIVGIKQNGEWSYSEMYVIINNTDEQIDLLGYD